MRRGFEEVEGEGEGKYFSPKGRTVQRNLNITNLYITKSSV